MNDKRKDEVAALWATSDQDLVRAFEKEIDAENEENPDERRLMMRFINLARKGAGMPELAVQ